MRSAYSLAWRVERLAIALAMPGVFALLKQQATQHTRKARGFERREVPGEHRGEFPR